MLEPLVRVTLHRFSFSDIVLSSEFRLKTFPPVIDGLEQKKNSSSGEMIVDSSSFLKQLGIDIPFVLLLFKCIFLEEIVLDIIIL